MFQLGPKLLGGVGRGGGGGNTPLQSRGSCEYSYICVQRPWEQQISKEINDVECDI